MREREKQQRPFLGLMALRSAIPVIAAAAAIVLAFALPAFASAAQTLTVQRAGSGTGTVTSSPSGINCGATCSADFAEGATVTLSASIGANSQAPQWSGCTSVNAENKCLVTMSTAKTVTATFNLVKHRLNVTMAGVGTGTVTSSPAGIECGPTCSADFPHGAIVTLTGSPGAETDPIVQWSGCTSVNAEDKCLVTMSTAKTVTATFNHIKRQLTVTMAGTGTGTVTSSPSGIECGPTCSAGFTEGATVTLTGVSGFHTLAVKWSGCTSVNAENKCLVSMSVARLVTATFDLEPQYIKYTVSVVKGGTGTGTVTSSPAGIECGPTCSAEVVSKTKVTLTAIPAEGSVFSHWSGGTCSNATPCERTINSSRTVKAVFTAVGQRTLTIAMAGTGTGAVKSKAAGIECTASCSPSIGAGTKITLTAVPGSSSAFSGWSGACSGVGPCKVQLSEDQSVTATFAKVPVPPSSGAVAVAGAAKVKGGRAFVRVSCNAPSSCQGSLRLLAKLKDKGKSVAIGSTTFSLVPGSATTLEVKLSVRARQRLKSAGHLQAKVTGVGIHPRVVRLIAQP